MMAMACLRFVTFGPTLEPLCRSPSLNLCMTSSAGTGHPFRDAFAACLAKLAFCACLPPFFLAAAIFLGVALPNEPTVPFDFIRSAACSIQCGSSDMSVPLRAGRLRLQHLLAESLDAL